MLLGARDEEVVDDPRHFDGASFCAALVAHDERVQGGHALGALEAGGLELVADHGIEVVAGFFLAIVWHDHEQA